MSLITDAASTGAVGRTAPGVVGLGDKRGIDDDPFWWREAVVYQVYPRSFADADGDGLGDIRGVASRVPYLRDLGVDAVWLSPFYPSPLADGGYDVADYRDVDPRLGTLADFDALVATLHGAGIRLIVDIVPNHTSAQHPWFQAALRSAKHSAERDRYNFVDSPTDEAPSDWQSHFGGSAWQQIEDGQFYLHLFAPEQPDLNWRNPEVRDEFLTTLRFWADRGVDGFRIDVAHTLVKDMELPLRSQPTIDHALPEDGTDPLYDRDEVHEIYRSWRELFDTYTPPRMAVAEAWVPASRRPRYASAEGLGQAFNFDLLRAPWDANVFTRIVRHNLELAASSGSSSTWVLSNHDVVRHASRYALDSAADETAWLLAGGPLTPEQRARGLRRAGAATLLVLALPGSTYLYQGEELGLFEVADVDESVLQDPIWVRSEGRQKGRDGCRVPLPWRSSGVSLGFGAAAPHLPQPAWFGDFSVERQNGDQDSPLSLYRRAIALRKKLVAGAAVTIHDAPDGVMHVERTGGWHSLTVFGPSPVALDALTSGARLAEGQLILSSWPGFDGRTIAGDTTIWIRTAGD